MKDFLNEIWKDFFKPLAFTFGLGLVAGIFVIFFYPVPVLVTFLDVFLGMLIVGIGFLIGFVIDTIRGFGNNPNDPPGNWGDW